MKISSTTKQRKGILVGGSWAIARLRTIESSPAVGVRSIVVESTENIPGPPAQILIGLARCGLGVPIGGVGVVGADAEGKNLIQACKREKIEVKFVKQVKNVPTGWVDVVKISQTGDSLIFWHPGAGALWVGDGIDWKKVPAGIFHLANIGLLCKLHKSDKKYGLAVIRLLASAQQNGLKTSISLMGESTPQLIPIIQSALKAIDYCIISESDAAVLTGFKLRDQEGKVDPVAIRHAAGAVLQQGPRELVVIYFGEGAFARTRKGDDFWKMAVKVPVKTPANQIAVHDGFCAGVLAGLHEGWPIDQILEAGLCMAAAASMKPQGIMEVKSLASAYALGKKYGYLPMMDKGD